MPPAEQLALTIVQRLQAAGHTAYFAGGCVRDRLMNRDPHDFDVATSARPEQVLALFPKSQQVGVAFGVVLVREKRNPNADKSSDPFTQVEVATFRSDGAYTDGRHPDSVHFTTAQNDAQRRDFTCNGLFLDPITNHIHDFVNGQQDIANQLLRAIGNPAARFGEDHLRLLRAVRFAAKLHFTIEPATAAAIKNLAPQICTISKERIHDELESILSHPTSEAAAILLQSTLLLQHLWPAELFPQPSVPRNFTALHLLPPDSDFVVALFALYKNLAWVPNSNPAIVPPSLALNPATVANLLRAALLLNNSETADLAWFLENLPRLLNWQHLTKASLKRLLADPRWPRLESLFINLSLDPQLRAAFDATLSQLRSEGVAPAPFVSGSDLINMGASPGPAFKRWLETLYDRQLNNDFASRQSALDTAQQLIDSKK